METNQRPSSTRFNSSAEFVNLRSPNLNQQDGSIASVSTTTNQQRSNVLSPDAKEFIPRQNHNELKRPDSLIKPLNSMKISNVQNRMNIAQHKELQPQNFQNNQYNHLQQHQQHHHLQQQQQQQHQEQVTNNYHYNGTDNSYSQTMQSIPSSENNSVQNQNVATQQDGARSHNAAEPSQDEIYAIHYIENIVSSLNENPGSFDSVAKQAQEIFEGFTDNFYVLSNAMEIIFNKSIEEQNFRYMGAKLYNLLDSIDDSKDRVFRNLLNFKLAYHKQEIISFIKDKVQHKVRGTTLFLAELYMQLRNNGDTVKEIAESIVFSIEQLLNNTSPENIKCICLTLKLAGYDLDKDCSDRMKKIISNLRTIDTMDVSTSRLLESVLKLKDNRWGRTEEIKEYPTNNAPYMNFCDEPVFYGPDGQILTEEESMFLASIANNENNDDNDSEYECNPEMDEETASAFKDFLKSNRKM